MSYRLLAFASGRGSNLQAIQLSIERGDLDAHIALIICNDEKAGVIPIFRDKGIEVRVVPHVGKTRQEHENKVLETIKDVQFDLVILGGYMRILSPEFIQSLSKPILNIHPSLLPAFPGLHAQKQALDYGVKYSGCTVHLVNEIVDGGKILGQKVVPVLENDSEGSLSARILEQEHILFSEVLNEIITNKILL